MREKLHLAMQTCDADAAAGGRALRSLMSEDPKDFLRASLSLLLAEPGAPGHEQLLKLLAGSDRVVEQVCDANLFTDKEAVELARMLAGAEPQLDTKLVRMLPQMSATYRRPANPESIDRVLML